MDIFEKILGFIIIAIMVGLFVLCIVIASPVFIIGAIIILIAIILGLIFSVVHWFQTKVFKTHHNCFDCEYYKLHNVAGAGDKCWFKCYKFDRIDDHSMNDNEQWKRCKYYQAKEK